MANYYQILVPLLSIFLVRVDLTDLLPLKIPVKLVRISDGDTLHVRHGNYLLKVRLAKLDAPEKSQLFVQSQLSAGGVSKKCLEETLRHEKDLLLTLYQYDMYGRVLGNINEVSLKLVKRGCASLYPFASFSSKQEMTKYLVALKKAKALKRGLWKYGGFLQPKMYRKISKRSGVRR